MNRQKKMETYAKAAAAGIVNHELYYTWPEDLSSMLVFGLLQETLGHLGYGLVDGHIQQRSNSGIDIEAEMIKALYALMADRAKELKKESGLKVKISFVDFEHPLIDIDERIRGYGHVIDDLDIKDLQEMKTMDPEKRTDVLFSVKTGYKPPYDNISRKDAESADHPPKLFVMINTAACDDMQKMFRITRKVIWAMSVVSCSTACGFNFSPFRLKRIINQEHGNPAEYDLKSFEDFAKSLDPQAHETSSVDNDAHDESQIPESEEPAADVADKPEAAPETDTSELVDEDELEEPHGETANEVQDTPSRPVKLIDHFEAFRAYVMEGQPIHPMFNHYHNRPGRKVLTPALNYLSSMLPVPKVLAKSQVRRIADLTGYKELTIRKWLTEIGIVCRN